MATTKFLQPERMSTVTVDYAPVNGSIGLSALVVFIPLLSLFVLLFVMPALYAGLIALSGLILVVSLCYLPVGMAFLSALNGFVFGIWPVCLIITAAIFLFDLSVISGNFEALKFSIVSVSKDKRILTLIVAFCFSSFLEGAGGFSSPVAISAMLLCGLGVPPLQAAAAGLIGNTIAVPFGGVAIPVITLKSITFLSLQSLSVGISRLIIPLALLMPFAVVFPVCRNFKELIGVWPAVLVAGTLQCGATLLIAQFVGPQLCSILGGLVGTLGTALFVKFVWSPKEILMTDDMRASEEAMQKAAASAAAAGAEADSAGKGGEAAGEASKATDHEIAMGEKTPLAGPPPAESVDVTSPEHQDPNASSSSSSSASDGGAAVTVTAVSAASRPRGPSAADAATLAGILQRSISKKEKAAGELDSAPAPLLLRESKESPASASAAASVGDLRINVGSGPRGSSTTTKPSSVPSGMRSPQLAVADHLAAAVQAGQPSDGRRGSRGGSVATPSAAAGTPISSSLGPVPIVRIVSVAKPGAKTAEARLRGENPHRGVATSSVGAAELGIATPTAGGLDGAARGRGSSLSLPPGTILIKRTTLKPDAIKRLDSTHLAAGLMPMGPTGTGGSIPISGNGNATSTTTPASSSAVSRGERMKAIFTAWTRKKHQHQQQQRSASAGASAGAATSIEMAASTHGIGGGAGEAADLDEEGGVTTPLATAAGATTNSSGTSGGGRSRRAGTAEVPSILQAPGVPITQAGETVAPTPVDNNASSSPVEGGAGVVATINPALVASSQGTKPHGEQDKKSGHEDAHAKAATGPRAEVEHHYDALHPPTKMELFRGWLPWVFLIIMIVVWGLPEVKAGLSKATVVVPIAGLNNLVIKPDPLGIHPPHKVAAVWTLDFLAATGICIYIVAFVTSAVFGMKPLKTLQILWRSVKRMALSCVTICVLLSLGYLLKLSGADSTLGLALSESNKAFPFIGPILGFLGVALTGSITTTSVLFGSLQVVAAEKIGLNPVQMVSSNSVAGAAGHIISTASMIVGAVSVGMDAKKITPVYRAVLPTALISLLFVCLWNTLVAYVIPGLIPYEQPSE